jgi:hypothetical protein
MSSPNPAVITDEMWRLWTDRPNKAWLLSGIYADKRGYHNTVNRNKDKWPGNYSIRLALDLKDPHTKARAIDLTMSESEMIKWTTHMRKSALDPNDDRLAAVREFYGTLDGKTVYGLIKDSEHGDWRRSSADDTHLWHGHTSIFTLYVANWAMLAPIISVWAGESLEEWGASVMPFPKLNDSGEEVTYWQMIYNTARVAFAPDLPALEVDGHYGPSTAAALKNFYVKLGGTGDYKGQIISGWMAAKLMQLYSIEIAREAIPAPIVSPTNPIDPEELKALVDDWLQTNLLKGPVTINAQIDGEIKL